MHTLSLIYIISLVALRNLWLHRVKTLLMGGILAFGTFLVVLGLSLLHDIESSMKGGIINSVAGHLQVYSKKAKDPLALFGGSFMGKEDLGEIENFAPLKEVLTKHPNVAEVVPMGSEVALLGRGNESDELFDSLRKSLKTGNEDTLRDTIDQVHYHLDELKRELVERRKITANQESINEQIANLEEARSPQFWTNFKLHSEAKMQFLETKIAPLSGEKMPVYLRYLGTDPDLFQKAFNKFKIVEGHMIPTGKRGILISHKFREKFLKLVPAKLLDTLYTKKVEARQNIADDAELTRLAKQLSLQHEPILIRLDKKDARNLKTKLEVYLASELKNLSNEKSLSELLRSFLVVNDENFTERHDWFYKNIAPLVRLYEISPDENIVLRSYTKNGYVKTVQLHVYGVYTFKGQEKSDLAGAFNIVDLVSFRELYGQMTEQSLAEIDELKKEIKGQDLAVDNIENQIFGEGAKIEGQADTNSKKTKTIVDTPIIAKKAVAEYFDPDVLSRGVVINSAIFLKDENLIQQTQDELEKSLNPLDIQIVDWQKASGLIGQFVEIVRYVLIFGVSIILLVALIIINNSLIVATFERTREIGTLRSFGAQKAFIGALFSTEAFFLSLIASLIGSLIAYLLILRLKFVGIPAPHQVLVFLFSGPRLFPHINARYFLVGPCVVTLLALISSLYPALFAAQIRPAQAMQEKE